MQAFKHQVCVGRGSEMVVKVPLPKGELAEFLLLKPDSPSVVGPPHSLSQVLEQFTSRPGPGRSIGHIDAQISEERASWGDR